MQNFIFENRTKIIFGRNTLAQVGPETAVLAQKVLLVYGRASIKENGVYPQVIESLRGAGLEVVEHGGVQANPVVAHVRAGIELARRQGAAAVVAVGGGSVIDSAKAIAAGIPAGHDVWQFFRGKKGVGETLPLVCVSTIAGSGSEMNGGMVLTNEETGQKIGIGNKRLQPMVAILDPATTFSVPPDLTAYGAVDTIAHLLEFYCTHQERQAPVQEHLMEGLARTVLESCERALADPRDYDSRADLLWSGSLALNGLTAAGLGRVGFPMHMIEHSLSALYGVAHGAGLAVVMPAWLRWQAEQDPARIARFTERVLGLGGGEDSKRAAAGIDRLAAWFGTMGCPASLRDLGIPAGAIPDIAANALAQAKLWRLRDYSQPLIESILHRCLP